MFRAVGLHIHYLLVGVMVDIYVDVGLDIIIDFILIDEIHIHWSDLALVVEISKMLVVFVWNLVL
jgi:hypothetical protein